MENLDAKRELPPGIKVIHYVPKDLYVRFFL